MGFLSRPSPGNTICHSILALRGVDCCLQALESCNCLSSPHHHCGQDSWRFCAFKNGDEADWTQDWFQRMGMARELTGNRFKNNFDPERLTQFSVNATNAYVTCRHFYLCEVELNWMLPISHCPKHHFVLLGPSDTQVPGCVSPGISSFTHVYFFSARGKCCWAVKTSASEARLLGVQLLLLLLSKCALLWANYFPALCFPIYRTHYKRSL